MTLFKVILISLIAVCPVLGQGDLFVLDDGAKLYLEEIGTGKTLLFIPGWKMTHRFFEHQKSHFSKSYHVVTYDPRGQGRSDKTIDGNNYKVHAADLRQILSKKDLNDVVIVSWSSGCLTAYAYIRDYGFDRIQKMVFIDEPPKWVGDRHSEWVYGHFDDYRSSLKSMISQPANPNGIIDWMLKEPIDSLTRQWMNEEMLMTPPHVALSLYVDGLASDYTDILKKIPSSTPTLFLVNATWYDQARSWLLSNTTAKVEKISSHAMFWEKPEDFNARLSAFLNQAGGE